MSITKLSKPIIAILVIPLMLIFLGKPASVQAMESTYLDSDPGITSADSLLPAIPDSLSPSRAEATWTFMVYLDGDNNLESAGITDFMEMSSVGSSSEMNIVVQFDRISSYSSDYGDWTDTRRFLVTPGLTPDAANGTSIGEANMGDPQTLVDFIQWATSTYPAQHYALVIWDHGSGWRFAQDERPVKAVAYDDSSGGDSLNAPELREAYDTLTSGGSLPFDLIGFDACLMGMIEVDGQIIPYASVRVGSEDTEPLDGWPYDTILSDLAISPDMTAAQLGTVIVDRYYESYGNSQTQSAVDLGAAYATLNSAVDDFAQALLIHGEPYKFEISTAQSNSQRYYDPSYLDLYDFAYEVNALVADPTIQLAAVQVMNAVDEAVIHEQHGSSRPDSHGISIYFPSSIYGYDSAYNGTSQWLQFTINTHWDEWLQFYLEGPDDPPANDDFDDAIVVTNMPYNHGEDTTSATTTADDPLIPCPSASQRYSSVWYRYTPSLNGTLTVDTLGSNYDTILSVWTGPRGNLTNLGCNDDHNGTLQSQVSLLVASGTTYHIEVAGYGSYSHGLLNLSMSLSSLPPTLIAPENGSVIADSTPIFDWYDLVGATQYQIQVDNNADFSSPDIDATVNASDHTPARALANDTYYWHVRANTGAWGSYSDTWVVTVGNGGPIVVDETADELNADGDCSLREAVRAANTNTAVDACPAGSADEADIIMLADGATYALDIAGADEDATLTGDLDIADNMAAVDLMLDVAGGGTATIDANGLSDRVLHVLSNATVDLTGVTISGGSSLSDGGGIYNDGGTLTITDSTLSYNGASSGGGICSQGNLTLSNTTVTDNGAAVGGGLYVIDGITTIRDSVLATNSATAGGGISNGLYAVANISTTTISYNTANGAGGGISSSGELTIDNSTISGNSGGASGGGISVWNGTTTVTSSTLSDNSADYGAGIHSQSNLVLSSTTVTSNIAHSGGGLYAATGTTTISDSLFDANNAFVGGGIFNNSNNSDMSVTASAVINNAADTAGGGINNGGVLTINSSTISDNSAGDYGAGIVSWHGTMTMTDSRLIGNSATNNGDALFSNASTTGAVSVTGTCIVNNGDNAFFNQSQSVSQTATGNWWGAADGPGPVGPGHGDTVSANVDYSGFLSAPILACPTLWIPSPTLLSPTDGSAIADSMPTFDWEDAAGVTEYQIQVDDNADFSSPEIDETVSAPTYTSTVALVDATYSWRVRAGNGVWSDYSDAWTVTLTSGPPGTATPGSPIGGATVESAPVTFSWPAAAGATQYRLYVINSTAGTLIHDGIHTASDLGCSGDGTCSVAPSASYTNGSYTWWLQSSNTYGDGPWSGPASFTFSCPTCAPPGAATPGSPIGGATVSSAPVTFSWPAVAAATQYRLYVVNSTAGTLIHDGVHTATDLGCSGGGTCSVAPSASYTNGDHTWYLQSSNSYGDGPWSGPASFTFDDGTGPPGTATPGSPVGTTVDSAPVTYSWPAVAGATQYRLYVVNNTVGVLVHDGVHTTTDLGCSGGGTCSAVPSASYTNGNHTWYLQSSNSYGDGPWSDPASFTFDDGTGPPGAATPDSPVGTTVTSAPVTYNWPAVAGATQYRLYVVNNTAGVLVHDGMHTATDLGCPDGTGTCSAAPSASYTNGDHTWYLQASNSYGDGPWSGPATFTFDDGTGPPGTATPGSPVGTTVTSAPVTYSWPAVTGATQYRLYVVNNTAGVLVHDGMHTATDLGCPDGTGTCSAAPSASYTNGNHAWYLQASNSYGDGLWSGPANFTFDCPTCAPPGTTTLLTPTDGSTVTSAPVTFTWSAVTGATQYRLYVNGPAGTAVHDGMHDAATACTGSTCSVTPSVSYTDGSYMWWVQPSNSYGDGPWASGLTFAFSGIAFSLLPDSRQMHLEVDIPYDIIWVRENRSM